MKYLITGNKGFIGTNLTNYLLSKNEKVVGIDYPDDIYDSVPDHAGIDIIVHLAAETNVRTSIDNPENTIIKNTVSTLHMLEVAKQNNAHFIFASSCGAASSTNPYSASKLAGEAICKAYRRSYDMKVSVLRFSNVYGPHSDHKESVIAKFIKAKLNNEPVTIFGSGHQMRDFIHVSDVCKAIHECWDNYTEISSGTLTSINTIIEMLDIKDIINDSPIEGEVFHPETFGWSGCEVGLKEGLASTLDWFSKLKNLIN